MNHMTSAGFDHARFDKGAVANDMAAIFGDGVRSSASPRRASPIRRSGNRRGLIVAMIAGTLATTVAVGVVGGNRAIDVPAAPPIVSRPGDREPRATVRPALNRQPKVAASPAVEPIPAPAAVVAAAPDLPAEKAGAAKVSSSSARAEAIVVTSLPAATAAAIPSRSPAAVEERAAREPAINQHATCNDNSDACLSRRIDTAERQLAMAYEEAVAVGVRSRVLRDYRSEWVRARDAAIERPAYALRLYGMITADLNTFADDAAARGGAAAR